MIQATRKNVCAIVPAFGEARFIGTVVCGILEHLDHVIVVDDYSPDKTTTVAREAGAEVVRHSENLGKGAAIKTGLRKVADSYRFFLFLDGDGQHDPAETPKFLAKATAKARPTVNCWLRRQRRNNYGQRNRKDTFLATLLHLDATKLSN
jgi:glycosyltransferase involved in cell wall biosynthesis